MREELIRDALRMFIDRKEYYQKHHNIDAAIAYESVVSILSAAIDGEDELLAQYDYFGED